MGNQPYQFQIVRSTPEFSELRSEWDTLLAQSSERSFYLSYDWFHAVLCLSGLPAGELYLTLVRRQGQLLGIIPCRIVSRRFRVFTLRSLELIGNIYSPFRGCLLARGEESMIAEAWAEFVLRQRRDDWEVMLWEGVSLGDPVVRALMSVSPVQPLLSSDFATVVTDLSQFSTAEGFYRALSKNVRQTIRTQITRMNREGCFQVVLTQGEALEPLLAMKHYKEIYCHSWKEPEPDLEFHTRLAAYLAPRGMLRLFILYFASDLKGVKPYIASYNSPIRGGDPPEGWIPLAACLFVLHDNQAYFLKTAYREEFARLGAGTVVFWFATKHLLEQDRVERIDHQKGGETYKLRWAGHVHETRRRLRLANPLFPRSLAEMWIERGLVAPYRRLRSTLRALQNRPSDSA